jgi:hypothetical protein
LVIWPVPLINAVGSAGSEPVSAQRATHGPHVMTSRLFVLGLTWFTIAFGPVGFTRFVTFHERMQLYADDAS